MEYNTGKKRYNTKTGILLIMRNDLRSPYKDSEEYYQADLYKSKGGEYFLYGHGGILSIFKGKKEDSIIPLEKEEAEAICKEFSKKVYQKEFC
jgi:hypothetical protein